VSLLFLAIDDVIGNLFGKHDCISLVQTIRKISNLRWEAEKTYRQLAAANPAA
jgi:hypothetical protein